jgi:hypothetical protein
VIALNGAGPATAGTVDEAQKVVVAGKPSSRSLTKPQGQLSNLAQRIHAEHQAVIAAVRSHVEHAMVAGDLLVEAKRQVGHGQWAEWVKRHCEISDRTARYYMQLAENRAKVESIRQRVADLTLRQAIKAISVRPELKNASKPSPKSPLSSTTGQPKQNRTTHRDLLALWLDLPVEERKHFFDAIGLRAILESIPDSWKDALRGDAS